MPDPWWGRRSTAERISHTAHPSVRCPAVVIPAPTVMDAARSTSAPTTSDNSVYVALARLVLVPVVVTARPRLDQCLPGDSDVRELAPPVDESAPVDGEFEESSPVLDHPDRRQPENRAREEHDDGRHSPEREARPDSRSGERGNVMARSATGSRRRCRGKRLRPPRSRETQPGRPRPVRFPWWPGRTVRPASVTSSAGGRVDHEARHRERSQHDEAEREKCERSRGPWSWGRWRPLDRTRGRGRGRVGSGRRR